MLAILHRCSADRHVPLPGRCVEDEVKVFFRTQTFEIRFACAIPGWPGLSCFDGHCLYARDFLWSDIAHCLELHTINTKEVAAVRRALQTHADESDAYDVHRRSGKKLTRRLAQVWARRGRSNTARASCASAKYCRTDSGGACLQHLTAVRVGWLISGFAFVTHWLLQRCALIFLIDDAATCGSTDPISLV